MNQDISSFRAASESSHPAPVTPQWTGDTSRLLPVRESCCILTPKPALLASE